MQSLRFRLRQAIRRQYGLQLRGQAAVLLHDGFRRRVPHVIGTAIQIPDGTGCRRTESLEIETISGGIGSSHIQQGIQPIQLSVVDGQVTIYSAAYRLLVGDGNLPSGLGTEVPDMGDCQSRNNRQDRNDEQQFDQRESVHTILSDFHRKSRFEMIPFVGLNADTPSLVQNYSIVIPR